MRACRPSSPRLSRAEPVSRPSPTRRIRAGRTARAALPRRRSRRASDPLVWGRSRMLTWGATADEVAGRYPGDDLIPDPDGGATMATTLAAPPEKVWPWLVQMGGDRGGWYSWDWIDNHGRAERRPDRARVAAPRTGPAAVPGAQRPDQLVHRGGTGTEPHVGTPLELRLDRPVRRGVAEQGAAREHRGDLGLPPPTGSRAPHPSGEPYPWPESPATAHRTARRVGVRARALHHADPPVPQPPQPSRRRTGA